MASHLRKSMFLAVSLLLFLSTSGIGKDTATAETNSPNAKKIDQLIEQLGSSDYQEREQAEKELLKLNVEAFFPLFIAQKHRDFEIADRAKYLVRKIQANLIMPGDSATVANLMRNIFSLDYYEQSKRVLQLSRLPNGEGLEALCRLVLFSESEISAHMAGLGIMQARLYDPNDPATEPNSQNGIVPLMPMRYYDNGMPFELELRLGSGAYRPPYPEPPKSNTVQNSGKPLGPKEREKIRSQLKSCDRPAAKLVFLYLDFEEAKTEDKKKTLYDQWHKICDLEEKEAQKQGLSEMNFILVPLLETQLEKACEIKLAEDKQAEVVRRILNKNAKWQQYRCSTMMDRLINEKVWKLAGMSILDFKKAMEEGIKKTNSEPDFLLRFSCLLIQAGKTKVGDELLELYATRYPVQGTSKTYQYIKVGNILVEEGLLDQAIAKYKTAIDAENMNSEDMTPEHRLSWDAFEHTIDIYEELGQSEKAKKTAEQMLATTKTISKKFQHYAVTALSNNSLIFFV